MVQIPPLWEVWALRGMVVALGIGILFTGKKMRSVRSRGFQSIEEELSVSEARFRAMFESAGIGIALVGMDRHPIEANAAMIEMTGYSPEEFFQMSGADLSYPEDADIGIPELKAVLEDKLNTYQIEKRYIRKGGQVYWVRLTNSVVRASDSRPQYFVTQGIRCPLRSKRKIMCSQV